MIIVFTKMMIATVEPSVRVMPTDFEITGHKPFRSRSTVTSCGNRRNPRKCEGQHKRVGHKAHNPKLQDAVSDARHNTYNPKARASSANSKTVITVVGMAFQKTRRAAEAQRAREYFAQLYDEFRVQHSLGLGSKGSRLRVLGFEFSVWGFEWNL